jgi:hypothetical protein
MKRIAIFCFLLSSMAQAGIVNPDCNAQKAMKSAAMNATIGVGGRCSATEAAKDTITDNSKIDEKVEKINDTKDGMSNKKDDIKNTVEKTKK